MSTTAPDKIEVKTIKHVFAPPERDQLHADLLVALATKETTEEEFEHVKATWKAKVTEADSRIGTLAATLRAGFELRPLRCVVHYRPKDRKKDYFLENGPHSSSDIPVLTEEMTDADFQADLLAAESQFEHREEIPMFPCAGNDSGLLVVGSLKGRWFTALRVTVGKHSLSERLDSEQRSYKQRFDAVRHSGKRCLEWLKEHFKEDAKGFEGPLNAAIEAQREREE